MAPRPLPPPRPALRALQALLLFVAVAGTLRLLSWWPRATLRAARARDVVSLEAAERAIGRRLALPVVVPRSVPWPPSRVQVLGLGPDVAVLELGGTSDGGVPLLVLAESVRGPAPLPDALFPAAMSLDARSFVWEGPPARLTRLRGEDGAAWVELAWEQDGQSFAWRSRGSLEQLVDLAQSVHREGP